MSELSIPLPPGVLEAIARRAAVLAAEQISATHGGADRTYMTLAEAAQYLRWPRQRLYKLTASKEIPHIKHQGRILLSADELDAWLETSRER